MKKHNFEKRRDALLEDIREVMDDVDELYRNGVEAGSEEGSKARAKLEEKLAVAKERFSSFEEEISERFKDGKELFSDLESDAGARLKRGAKQADEVVHEKPYYAMGFAALAGLVVGVLLNRR